MTKEKIIDGVDVSDCMYYEPKAIKMNCHEQAITKPCNTSPICYYKLLHKAYKNCECLEQENEKLKEELKRYELYVKQERDNNFKYEKTLQEIKEIFSEPCLEDEDCETCNANCSNKDILKLIKKAEEE